MLTQLTDREAIRRYLRALRREQLLARVQRDEGRVERLLSVQTVAVDAPPPESMLSLLDEPRSRERVSAITIDLARLEPGDRALLEQVLWRADAICRLRSPQPVGPS